MRKLYLDFETRSRADLRKVGAYLYARDASTCLLSAAWALDDGDLQVGELHVWKRDDEAAPPWLQLAQEDDVVIVAHNAEFEWLILWFVCGVRLPISKFRCTAAQAARASLPRSLDKVGEVLQLSHRKDKATGSRVLSKLARPRRPSKANPDEFWEEGTAGDDFEQLYEYNAGDTLVTRELHHAIPKLSQDEQALWELTVRMNARGMAVDTDALPLAILTAQAAEDRLAARWLELTGVKHGAKGGAAAVGLDSLAKAKVRAALASPTLLPNVREALLVRQQLAKTSVKKLGAFVARTDPADDRIRGMLTYAGAERTARWSGAGVQPQNFPHGWGAATDVAFEALRAGGLHLFEADVLKGVSSLLRGFFVGPFFVGDYAQIEARALAVLAGQADLVEAFATGADVYCQMAEAVYGHKVKKGDKDDKLGFEKRQLGKVLILGCGYGLGGEKFREQLQDQFGVKVPLDEAFRLVEAYRTRYPAIPRFWTAVERAWAFAVRTEASFHRTPELPGLAFGVVRHGRRRLGYIQLPSRRAMYYYEPRVDEAFAVPEKDEETEEVRIRRFVAHGYTGRILGTKWGRVPTYGGKLAENVVQAYSRDVMAAAMLRLDRAGFPLTLTVHDEVVSETAPGRTLEEFERLMSERPDWAKTLPLAVEAFETRRYRK